MTAATGRLGYTRDGTMDSALPPLATTRWGRLLVPSDSSESRLDRDLAIVCTLLAVALTAFIPGLRLHVSSSSQRVAVNTITVLLSSAAAVLFLGRFLAHQRLRALLVSAGLLFVTVSTLCSQVLQARHIDLMGHSAVWIGLGGRLVGWLFLATAALVPDRVVTDGNWRLLLGGRSPGGERRGVAGSRHAIAQTAGSDARMQAIRSVLVAGLALFLVGIGLYVILSNPVHRGPLGDPDAVLALQIAIAAIAGVAAWGFLRAKRRDPDPTLRVLAVAALFGAGSSLAFCAYPTLPLSYLGMGDLLRLGSAILLLLGACVEWYIDERALRARALAQERRRIAADVHDLIMQDLSLALSTARSMADDPERASQAGTIVAASERALAGAREVVSALAAREEKPIVDAVEGAVETAARNAIVRFDGSGACDGAQPDELTQDSLVHIAREAVTNASKHGRARDIEVVLEHGDEWRLLVRDEGRGFDPNRSARHRGDASGMGFGLDSMRRRAEELGGSLRVRSAPGRGTTVEAVLP